MNNSVFGKTLENFRKHSDIKLITTEKRRILFGVKPNYRTTKFVTENLNAIEMSIQVFQN